MRKEAKKQGRKKPRKDPGVPNSAPFKEALLREAELRKQRVRYVSSNSEQVMRGYVVFESKVAPHWFGSLISLMAWMQLEELKEQQKLDRQKEQEKKRKLETNPGVKPSNLEPVKEVRLSIFMTEGSPDGTAV